MAVLPPAQLSSIPAPAGLWDTWSRSARTNGRRNGAKRLSERGSPHLGLKNISSLQNPAPDQHGMVGLGRSLKIKEQRDGWVGKVLKDNRSTGRLGWGGP